METMEAVRLLMEKRQVNAKCILDCIMRIEAGELRAWTTDEPEFDSEPLVDVKAYVQGNVIGNTVKASEAAPPPKLMASAVNYAPICVGGIPNAVSDADIG